MSQICVRSNQNPPGVISGDGGGNTPLRNKTKAQEVQPSANRHGGARRQENVRWASELSFSEGSRHWQEQVGQLQRQLDFSTSMCQTLLQDQQVSSGHSWKGNQHQKGQSLQAFVSVCVSGEFRTGQSWVLNVFISQQLELKPSFVCFCRLSPTCCKPC